MLNSVCTASHVQLGRLSLRQVHAESLAYETGRWGGRLPFGRPSTPTCCAALSSAELSDFHRQLAVHQPEIALRVCASGTTQQQGGALFVHVWLFDVLVDSCLLVRGVGLDSACSTPDGLLQHVRGHC